MAKDKPILHSWQLDSSMDGPPEFQVKLILPRTGMGWSMVSGQELAITVYEFCHERTLPRWRRVWNALRGV